MRFDQLVRWVPILSVPLVALAVAWNLSGLPKRETEAPRFAKVSPPPTALGEELPLAQTAERTHAPQRSHPIHQASTEDRSLVEAQWDEMTPAKRVKVQRVEFSEAMMRARQGDDLARNLARAEDALSLLRADLHATSRGRDEYTRLRYCQKLWNEPLRAA